MAIVETLSVGLLVVGILNVVNDGETVKIVVDIMGDSITVVVTVAGDGVDFSGMIAEGVLSSADVCDEAHPVVRISAIVTIMNSNEERTGNFFMVSVFMILLFCSDMIIIAFSPLMEK